MKAEIGRLRDVEIEKFGNLKKSIDEMKNKKRGKR